MGRCSWEAKALKGKMGPAMYRGGYNACATQVLKLYALHGSGCCILTCTPDSTAALKCHAWALPHMGRASTSARLSTLPGSCRLTAAAALEFDAVN